MMQSVTALPNLDRSLLVGAISLLMSMALATAASAQNRIVPGQSVGQIRLGQTLGSVQDKLGKADKSDGATGSFWDTWFSHAKGGPASRLEVYSARTSKAVEAHVRQIRVTSPYFSTQGGVSPRSSSASIRRQFPGIGLRGYYQQGSKRVDVYDDKAQGIAFEISHRARQCVGIIVHRPNRSFRSILRNQFRPLGE